MGFSLSHLLVVLVIVFVLFGAGKLPRVMGDLGRGLRSFKSGLSGDDEQKKLPSKDNKDDSSV